MLTARYIRQMPFVGTLTHRFCTVVSAWEQATSKADVNRQALDAFFELDDGELPPGDDRTELFNAWVKAGEPDESAFDAFMKQQGKKV